MNCDTIVLSFCLLQHPVFKIFQGSIPYTNNIITTNCCFPSVQIFSFVIHVFIITYMPSKVFVVNNQLHESFFFILSFLDENTVDSCTFYKDVSCKGKY